MLTSTMAKISESSDQSVVTTTAVDQWLRGSAAINSNYFHLQPTPAHTQNTPVFQVNNAPVTLKLPVCLEEYSKNDMNQGETSVPVGSSGPLCGPVIREQGPSNPSSPTTPRQKRPSPLTPEAMRRINLLDTNQFDSSKLSPMSPNFSTSDLGSSPRSSISLMSPNAMFQHFRDVKKSSSDFTDVDSVLSPGGVLLSPAPFSPFSDSAFTDAETCVSSPDHRSSQSTLGKRSASSSSGHRQLHFSFEDTNTKPMISRGSSAFLAVPSIAETRVRSQSDSDMSAAIAEANEERNKLGGSSTVQFKKRLLHKYEKEQQEHQGLREAKSDADSSRLAAMAHGLLAPSNVFASNSSIDEALSGTRFENWMRNQMLAWQTVWYGQQQQNAAATSLYNAGLLPHAPHSHPTTASSNMSLLAPPFGHTSRMGTNAAPGPLKQLWRRSRSESDVQGPHVCRECGQAFAVPDRLAKHIASRHRDRSANRNGEDGSTDPTNANNSPSHTNHKPHKCHVCPKSFGRSDMLTRHMRLHTGVKPYACSVCGQEFSRSDHLSTHQRTHTGEKPYQCPQCSYAASRRDMITRHMRTHSRNGVVVPPVPPMNRRGQNHHSQSQVPSGGIPPTLSLSIDTGKPSSTSSNSLSVISTTGVAGTNPLLMIPGVRLTTPDGDPPPLKSLNNPYDVGTLAGDISSIRMKQE